MCLAPRYISGATAAPCSASRKRASPRATPCAPSVTGASTTTASTAVPVNRRIRRPISRIVVERPAGSPRREKRGGLVDRNQLYRDRQRRLVRFLLPESACESSPYPPAS